MRHRRGNAEDQKQGEKDQSKRKGERYTVRHIDGDGGKGGGQTCSEKRNGKREERREKRKVLGSWQTAITTKCNGVMCNAFTFHRKHFEAVSLMRR